MIVKDRSWVDCWSVGAKRTAPSQPPRIGITEPNGISNCFFWEFVFSFSTFLHLLAVSPSLCVYQRCSTPILSWHRLSLSYLRSFSPRFSPRLPFNWWQLQLQRRQLIQRHIFHTTPLRNQRLARQVLIKYVFVVERSAMPVIKGSQHQ